MYMYLCVCVYVCMYSISQLYCSISNLLMINLSSKLVEFGPIQL